MSSGVLPLAISAQALLCSLSRNLRVGAMLASTALVIKSRFIFLSFRPPLGSSPMPGLGCLTISNRHASGRLVDPQHLALAPGVQILHSAQFLLCNYCA